MIHVLTVHWETENWIDLQLEYLGRNIDRPHKVYAFLNGMDAAPHREKFFYASAEDIASHATKLNLLADMAVFNAEGPDDWLVFVDSDAFPIASITEYAERNLARYPLIAVRRDENIGDVQPHPCFCITTVGFWKKIRGDWHRGYQWKNAEGRMVSDVGGNLLKKLQDENVEWLPMLRSNKVNLHPLYFGIYQDLVYHHGAGSRRPADRIDKDPLRKLPWLLRKLSSRLGMRNRAEDKRVQNNLELSEQVMQEIRSNDQFYRRFI